MGVGVASVAHCGRGSGGGLRTRFLTPLGLFAGFVDSTGGGGWGPVATPALLATGRLEPRKVIGSVDTSEFIVAVSASAGFLIGLGSAGFPFQLDRLERRAAPVQV